MNYFITATSTYTNPLFRGTHVGHIHSVYRNTANMVFDDTLLALQSLASPLSPVSLISTLNSTQLAALKFSPGQLVLIRYNELLIDNRISFCYTPTEVYDSFISPSATPFISILTEHIESVLMHSHIGQTSLLYPFTESVIDNMVISAARTHILQCDTLLGQQDYKEAAKTLSGLIGLGMGLTPSGDDFLCGVLAGLIHLNQVSHPFTLHLTEQIKNKLDDTNDISKTFLKCALSHHFSKAVIHLFTLPSVEEISNDFSKIGHSSGMDTLSGVLYALQLGFNALT